MKRLMAILVLVLAVPAMATITFTATPGAPGSGLLTIAYSGDQTTDLPRGIALRVGASDGAVVDFAGTTTPGSWDANFNTFIDFAFSAGQAYVIGAGQPLAIATGPGALTADAGDFSISMGVLDQSGKQGAGPQTSANLITLKFKQGTANQSTITISADTLRGPNSGVVGSVLASNLQTAPITAVVTFAQPECVKTTAPFYADWVAWGKPDCWCYERQCRGDLDGKSLLGKPVVNADLNLFKLAFNKNDADLKLVTNGICADLNHASLLGKRVVNADLNEFKKYFNQLVASVPSCDMTNYNFWKTAP